MAGLVPAIHLQPKTVIASASEAIHGAASWLWIASSLALLAMTAEALSLRQVKTWMAGTSLNKCGHDESEIVAVGIIAKRCISKDEAIKVAIALTAAPGFTSHSRSKILCSSARRMVPAT